LFKADKFLEASIQASLILILNKGSYIFMTVFMTVISTDKEGCRDDMKDFEEICLMILGGQKIGQLTSKNITIAGKEMA
jgi:hypothetical protein